MIRARGEAGGHGHFALLPGGGPGGGIGDNGGVDDGTPDDGGSDNVNDPIACPVTWADWASCSIVSSGWGNGPFAGIDYTALGGSIPLSLGAGDAGGWIVDLVAYNPDVFTSEQVRLYQFCSADIPPIGGSYILFSLFAGLLQYTRQGGGADGDGSPRGTYYLDTSPGSETDYNQGGNAVVPPSSISLA